MADRQLDYIKNKTAVCAITAVLIFLGIAEFLKNSPYTYKITSQGIAIFYNYVL